MDPFKGSIRVWVSGSGFGVQGLGLRTSNGPL